MNTISSALPLALRTGSHGETARAAQGFGTVDTGAIERVQARFLALVQRLEAEGSNGARVGSPMNNAPELRTPDQARLARGFSAAGIEPGNGRMSAEGALLALVGTLGKLVGNNSLANLQANSKLRTEMLAGRGARAEQLNAAHEAAQAEERAAADAVDGASADAQRELAAAEAARSEVDRLQRELDGLDPESPDYDAQRTAKEAELGAAKQAASSAGQTAEQASARLAEASLAYAAAIKVSQGVARDIDAFNREDPIGIRPPEQNQLSRSARMQALIGMLSQIMADASMDKIHNDSEAAIKRLEASQKEQLKLAEEQEAEMERARAAEKKSGCFGKVFGWVSKALAVVGSVVAIAVGALTANPLLVVAGTVGLVMAVDSIQAEFTGFSVMGKATEAIAKVVSQGLVALGVDKTIADSIAAVVATIVVMVAIIAATVAAGNFSGAATQMGKITLMIKQAVEVVQVLAQMASVASTLATSVGALIVAGIQVDIAKLLAMLEKMMLSDDIVRELLAMVQEAAGRLNQTSLDLMTKASDILAEEASTSRHVLSHIRTSA